MKSREKGFFDEKSRLAKVARKGGFLEELNEERNNKIDWEQFRTTVEKVIRERNRKGPGGRPPSDAVVMVKAFILREFYQLSDDAMECQIMDGLSFNGFSA